jgi:hypothetical protein
VRQGNKKQAATLGQAKNRTAVRVNVIRGVAKKIENPQVAVEEAGRGKNEVI